MNLIKLELLNRLHNTWHTLSLRDKYFAAVGILFTGFCVFYYLIYQPYLDSVNYWRQRLLVAQKNLAWMEAADVQLRSIQLTVTYDQEHSSPVIVMGRLQVDVEKFNLAAGLSEIKQLNDKTIILQFAKINFDTFMQWFVTILQELKLEISQYNVVATEVPGMVDANLTLLIT